MKTPAYWPTRILLAVGTASTAAIVVAALVGFGVPPGITDRPMLLGLPAALVITGGAVGLAVVGLIWMLRIFRGPRDEPPAWRHRERR